MEAIALSGESNTSVPAVTRYTQEEKTPLTPSPLMKAYSLDIRKRIVTTHLIENVSIRQVATRFRVSKSLVQKLVKQQKNEGNVQPKVRGKPQFSHLTNAEAEVRLLVAEHGDATLIELCELFAQKTGNWVSPTALCRYLKKIGLSRKKKLGTVAKPLRKEF